MVFSLRAATASDQLTIDSMVRAAQINPSDLKWPNFIVAESEGQIVGVGQVKQHRDGSRELASIAVRPGHKRQGVGSAICRALIERTNERPALPNVPRQTRSALHPLRFPKGRAL